MDNIRQLDSISQPGNIIQPGNKRQRKIKASVSLLTAAAMLTLAGCGGNGNGAASPSASGGASSPAASGAEASASASPSETPSGPPVEITMSAPAFEKSFPAGFQDDPVMKEIEKRLNIKVNITPGNAVGDISAKFAAQLASGDLPDIAFVPTPDLLPKVVSAGAALTLDDLLDEFAPDIVSNTPQRIDYSRKFLSKDVNGSTDNKVRFINLVGDYADDPLQAQVAPYLRYDLWKQLGYPKLESLDDYLNVLAQMQQLEPKNANGEKNYGVSAWFGDSPGWAQWSLDVPFSMFKGVSNNMIYDLDMVTYEVMPRLTDPNSTFFEGVEFYRKANKMGLLDPDAFTMKFADFLNKVSANRIFLGWSPWSVDNGNVEFTKEGQTDKGYFQMPAPNDLDQYMLSFDQPQGGSTFFIPKNSKHPKEALELLNFLISYEGAELIFNGVKGETWDEVDGQPQLKAETIEGLKSDPDYRLKTGVYKYHNISGRGLSAVDPKYDTPVYFSYLPDVVKERLTPLQKEGAEHFGVELPGDLYTKQKKYTSYDTSIVASLPAMPNDLTATLTKITTYVQTNQIKLIINKDDAEYEAAKAKFIKDVQDLGADKLLDWYKTEIGAIVAERG
ncbi:extracellular solute-binding protein [Cohnella fermenti]|uniref:Extracellular solute-binding protein n=1 Tax=Cohnella fermenti TaxID=2565925 RepID=A0A4S4BKT4_9BACL|nr:extracellular solute-binding protein [Cohnella fermenti]THF75251.1 extracellular solute-binding protein [Cohnella fermenti]